jgi:hypothetical protein
MLSPLYPTTITLEEVETEAEDEAGVLGMEEGMEMELERQKATAQDALAQGAATVDTWDTPVMSVVT